MKRRIARNILRRDGKLKRHSRPRGPRNGYFSGWAGVRTALGDWFINALRHAA